MKTRHFFLKGIILMLFFVFGTAAISRAEVTENRLFTLKVTDGYTTYKLPVYEFDDEGTITVGIKNENQSVVISRNASSIAIKQRSFTQYFKDHYTDAKFPAAVKTAASVKKKGTLTRTDGSKLKYYVSFVKLPKPAISSVTVEGGGTATGLIMRTDIAAAVSEEVTCKVRITNSNKKLVYAGTVGTGNHPVFTFYWNLTASKNNKAGYAADTPVDSGKYTLTAYLYYKEDGKTKKIKKSAAFTIRDATIADQTLDENGNPGGFAVKNQWPWTMIVTDNRTVDYLAELICQKILNPNMTEYQRAKAIHKYCVLNFYRTPMNTLSAAKSISDKLDYTSEEAKARIKKYGKKVDKMIASGKAVVNNTDNRELGSRLNRMITAMGKQTGDCLNMAYYMEALMRHAGLECDILYNDLPYGHELKHFWNTVKVDGVVYMCDARIENARLDGNNVTFSHFLRGKNTMSKISADDDLRYGTICSTGHYRETYKTVSNTDYPRG